MKYCAMGNPGAGNARAMCQRDTDIRFPIRFWYFTAPNDEVAWNQGCAIGYSHSCDGVYIFKCREDNTVECQLTPPEILPTFPRPRPRPGDYGSSTAAAS